MSSRIAAVVLAFGVVTTGAVYTQSPAPNPTQQTVTTIDAQVPIFRITVVGRTTPAVNYRPRSGDTRIDFSGTPLMAGARGSATVSGEKGYMKIDARFDRLRPPSSFGSEYLTYVLWAVTPEGRATNLGEVQYDDDDARVRVTTELQAFGLIVTAEPYFAVTQPSDVVVMENVVRDGTVGKAEIIQAKYDLLKRGSYLMNQSSTQLQVRPLEPGSPLDLAEARNAVALARIAGADRYARDTYEKAAQLLATAEDARERRRKGNEVQMAARQAVQTAEDARLVAVQRQEEEFRAEQTRQARLREQEAIDRANVDAARRRDAELTAQREAEARQREAAARAQAERSAQAALVEQAAAARAKAEADAARLAADAARAQAEDERARADAARRDAEAQAARANAAVAQSEQEKAQLRDQLRQQLNVILETRETARGLIVNLSDVLFDTDSANLKPGAREKLARVSGILGAHPGLKMDIEGHADSTGTNEHNQRLSEHRAESVRDYLVTQHIAPSMITVAGFGEEKPVATNATAAGRQQNRRVELIVSGEPIGTN